MFERAQKYLTDPSDFATRFDLTLGAVGLGLMWSSEVPPLREKQRQALAVFCVGATCLTPVIYRALKLESTDEYEIMSP